MWQGFEFSDSPRNSGDKFQEFIVEDVGPSRPTNWFLAQFEARVFDPHILGDSLYRSTSFWRLVLLWGREIRLSGHLQSGGGNPSRFWCLLQKFCAGSIFWNGIVLIHLLSFYLQNRAVVSVISHQYSRSWRPRRRRRRWRPQIANWVP